EAFKNPDFQQSSEFMRLGSELNALLRLAPDGRPRREAAGPVKTAKASAARELDVKPGSKTPTPPTSRPVAVRDIEASGGSKGAAADECWRRLWSVRPALLEIF
ncbi:unnamed protein product, partial [Effrenium voratum]